MIETDWSEELARIFTTHLSINHDQVAKVIREFECDAFRTIDPFKDRTSDTKALDALETAVRRLAPLLKEVSAGTSMTLMGAFNQAHDRSESSRLCNTIYCLSYKRDELLSGIAASRESLAEHDPMIRRSLKNTNVTAIHALDAIIGLWTKYQERPAPKKALNPASKFGAFVADIFEVCGIDARAVHRHAESHRIPSPTYL